MRAGQLDRLFERFRRKGDVHALGEVFDATAPELYRVAVHLTRDLHEAEDLVQSTFLAAIEARDSYDAKRDLLPWLLGILTRKAAWERRKGSRVIEPDRLATRESTAPSGEAETSELSQSVTDAVERLPSPYREVLVAHLRVGKSPNEIALELGRAPGTVRVQLHRGLEMLRKSLPAGFAVGALAGISPRGFAALRAAVLSSAETASTSIAVGAVIAPVLSVAGGVTMSAKALAAAAAALLAVVWIGLRAPKWVAPQAPEVAQASSEATPLLAAATPPQTSAVQVPSERVEVQPAAQARAVQTQAVVDSSVSGVLLRPDGTAASGVFVALLREIEGRPQKSMAETTTGSDGSFHLQAKPGRYFVVGVAEGFLPIALPATLLQSTELRLEPATFAAGARISGVVRIVGIPTPPGCQVQALLRAEGSDLDLAGQSLIWSEGRLLMHCRKTLTDADGRFTLEGLESQLHVVSVERTPDARVLKVEQEAMAPRDGLVLDIDYPRVVLRVESSAGPLDADVWLTEKVPDSANDWGWFARPVAEIFVQPGIAYSVRVEKEGFATAHFDLAAMKAGEIYERTVELAKEDDRAALVIDLVAPPGQTIQRAEFALFGGEAFSGKRMWFASMTSDGRTPDIVRELHSADGSFRLEHLPPGRYEVSVRPGSPSDRASTYWYHDPLVVELPPNGADRRRVDLLLGGRFRVQCGSRAGVSLGASCQLFDSWGTEIPVGFCTRDDKGAVWSGIGALNASAPQGTNELAFNLAPGKYELRLSLKGYLDASRVFTVEPGKTFELSVILEKG